MTRSQATPASSQIIALEGMVQRLEQRVVVQQARIAELRGALEQVGCLMLCGKKDQLPGRCDNAAKVVKKVLTKPDNLSALEAAKSQARREALMEAADMCDELESHYSAYKDTALLNGDVGLSNAASGEPRASRFITSELRRMVGEVK